MRNSKKAILATLAFLLCFVLIAAALFVPHVFFADRYYENLIERELLANQLDALYLGACQGMCAYIPEVIDAELGWNSYNLSENLMPIYTRTRLLELELERNPIQTVVVEISFDALTRQQEAEKGEGDANVFILIPTAAERIRYMKDFIRLDELIPFYAVSLFKDLDAAANLVMGDSLQEAVSGKVKSNRGYSEWATQDNRLAPEDVAALYQSEARTASVREENVAQLNELIDFCQAKGIRIIVTTVPLTDEFVWRMSGLETMRKVIAQICEEQGCEFYDFNLLKNRAELLSDEDCFFDHNHTSRKGAEIFSQEFARLMKLYDAGEDLSQLFYPSYDEALLHSVYAQVQE